MTGWPEIDVARVADRLDRARVDVRPVPSVTDDWPGLDERAAWLVQDHLTRVRSAGDPVVGHKVGLTGLAARQAFGRTDPVSGRVFAASLWPSRATVDRSDWIGPKLEPECAFILRTALSGPDVSPEDARASVGHICPAFEIADSRYGQSASSAVDLIADNAAGGGVVLNRAMAVPPDQVDFSQLEVEVSVDRRRVDAVRPPEQSDPYLLIAWLANSLHQRGWSIDAGQFVITGSWVAPVDAIPGRQVRASYPGIGTVEVAVR